MKNFVRLSNVSKSFGKKKVLDNVSFSVYPSETLGLIGPNGSGKTTLLNIIMSMLKPDSGKMELNCQLGMAVSRRGFFSDMTVRKNLEMYSSLMKKPVDLNLILKEMMIDFADLRFSKLSTGMKQKVSLAYGIISDQPLLLLDEPINHLDIDSILVMRKILAKRRESGKSTILTSHILADVEKVCGRIVFLKNGKIFGSHKTAQLISEYGSLENAYQNLVSEASN